jgi:hypothetical protein
MTVRSSVRNCGAHGAACAGAQGAAEAHGAAGAHPEPQGGAQPGCGALWAAPQTSASAEQASIAKGSQGIEKRFVAVMRYSFQRCATLSAWHMNSEAFLAPGRQPQDSIKHLLFSNPLPPSEVVPNGHKRPNKEFVRQVRKDA